MPPFLSTLLSELAAELVLVLLLALVSALALRYRSRVRSVTAGRHTAAPDGQQAAYEAGGEIYVTGPAGGLRNITRHPAADTGPLWSPDSTWLAFTSNRGGDWDVWVADVGSGRLARLTRSPGPERPVGWNARGDLIVNLGGSYLTVPKAEIARRLGVATAPK